MGIVIATKVGRHTALIARQTSTYIELVRLTSKGLVAERLTEEQLVSDWGMLTRYTDAEGVRRFLQLAAKVRTTARARTLLMRLGRDYLEVPSAFNTVLTKGDENEKS